MALPGVRIVLNTLLWEAGLWKFLRKLFSVCFILPPTPFATTVFLPHGRKHSLFSRRYLGRILLLSLYENTSKFLFKMLCVY